MNTPLGNTSLAPPSDPTTHRRPGYRAEVSGLPYPRSVERQALTATLDTLALGVIIVTDESRMLYANRAAIRMLARGRPVRSLDGRLSARDATVRAQLAHALALALHGEPRTEAAGIAVALGSGFGEPAIAHVLPLARSVPGASPMSRAAVAVFIVPAIGDPGVVPGALAASLGLTPCEARLLEKLAAGATLANAAHALGIAGTTAKTHLTHIFSKAGVSRQAELIALIHRLVPPVLKPAAP